MPQSVLRFGNFLAPSMMPVYRAIAEHVGQRLGCAASIEEGVSYDQACREFDVCFICGLAYVELAKGHNPAIEPIAAPVLRGARYCKKPIYFSDVVVHRDSAIFSFDELRGRSWSYNEPFSQSGYGITCYWLSRHGEDASFFGQVKQAGWHERSIEWVCSGAVDASAIDSHVLALAKRNNPELRAQLRVIATLGPSTIQPVTVSRRLSTSLKRRLQSILVEAASHSGLKLRLNDGLIDRFVPMDDQGYDDLRAMRSQSEAAGCLDLDAAAVVG